MNSTPVSSAVSWTPKGGWNPCFSEQEKIKAVHLFFFFKDTKRYPAPQAEALVHMALWKQKYPMLKYEPEQERILSQAMKPTVVSTRSVHGGPNVVLASASVTRSVQSVPPVALASAAVTRSVTASAPASSQKRVPS
jgi:hypothetical protein